MYVIKNPSSIKIKKGDVISIDGKSIRGTVTNPNNSFQNFTSLVSLYVKKKHQVLSLEKLKTKKENEVPVVQKLIKILDLEGVTFTLYWSPLKVRLKLYVTA